MHLVPLQTIIILACIISTTTALIFDRIGGDIYAVIVTAALGIAGGSNAALRGVQNGAVTATANKAIIDAVAEKVADDVRAGKA